MKQKQPERLASRLTFRRVAALGCAIAGMAAYGAETPVFIDTFGNGAAADSDFVSAAWPSSAVPANTSIAESGGQLILSAGGPASPDGVLTVALRSGAPAAPLNFFRQRLRFDAVLAIGGDAPTLSQRQARFALASSDAISYSAEDALSIRFRGDNTVALGVKLDRPAINAESVALLINNAAVGGAISGFSLALDATEYALTVYHSGGSGSTAFNGPHGLIGAQWGARGDSTMILETTRSTSGSGAGQSAACSWDSLSVARLLPPPRLFEDAFGNGIPANSDHIAAFWTPSFTASGSVAENGNLTLSAVSASSGNIQTTMASALNGAFNFFDNPIKISADVAVSGDTAETWMPRGRLALASASQPGRAAPDTLIASFRAQNNVALSRKIDAPNVDPDANHASVVSLLSGGLGNSVVGVSGNDLINRFELILDSTRFQIKAFNGGKGCGIVRFSGEHGISRAQWGANGDSALLLETARMSGAAGTSAVSVWDNLRIESAEPLRHAERSWDFQATYATNTAVPPATATYDFRLWLPAEEPVIRGIILFGPGSGEDFRYFVHDQAAQDAARVIGFGLLGYTNGGNMNFWSNNPVLIQGAVQAVLDAAAAASARPEISNAPLMITGLSAGAFDSSYLARNWPQRTIAFVPHRGNDFSNPVLSEEAKRVPGLFVAGSKDGNSLTEPYYMKTRFDSWRSQGGQVAFAVDWGVGHTPRGNQGWEGTMTWFVEVANLRWPRPMAPSTVPGNPPALIDLPENSGWLADTTTFSAPKTPGVTYSYTDIAPFASYGGAAAQASWLPNETCARMFRALASTDLASRTEVPIQTSVRIAAPEQYLDPVPSGRPVMIEVDPREFDNATALAQVEFFDGAEALGVDSAGPEWSLAFTPHAPGLHTLNIVATDALGAKRAAFRTLLVAPGPEAAAARWRDY